MEIHIGRRKFINHAQQCAGVVAHGARAQQAIRRLGVLMTVAETDPEGRSWLSAFTQELSRLGWSEGPKGPPIS